MVILRIVLNRSKESVGALGLIHRLAAVEVNGGQAGGSCGTHVGVVAARLIAIDVG